ncbi:MAG: hypothetical protein LBE75_07525 [Burkholderiales bacterium]|nr:hypothetical protein [Burkholderiales bacterium]
MNQSEKALALKEAIDKTLLEHGLSAKENFRVISACFDERVKKLDLKPVGVTELFEMLKGITGKQESAEEKESSSLLGSTRTRWRY